MQECVQMEQDKILHGYKSTVLKRAFICVFWFVYFHETVEALHLGTLMAAHGYFFPISDHVLTLKDDGTFYRFQVSLIKIFFNSKNKSAFSLFYKNFENYDLFYFDLS